MADRKTKWNADNVKAAAAVYGNVADFRKGDPKAYSAAHRLKIFKAVTAHMNETRHQWDDENVTATAKQYNTRGDFARGAPGAYTFASRGGILNQVCAHMPDNVAKVNAKWTAETLAEEAGRFENRSAFRTGNRSAYVTASRMGILDALFADA